MTDERTHLTGSFGFCLLDHKLRQQLVVRQSSRRRNSVKMLIMQVMGHDMNNSIINQVGSCSSRMD